MVEYTNEQCIQILKTNKLLLSCVGWIARNGRITLANLASELNMTEDEVEEVLEKNAHLELYQITDLSKVRFHSDVDLYELTKKGDNVFDSLRGIKGKEPNITLIDFLCNCVAARGEVKLYPQEKKYKVLDLIYNTPEEVDLSSKVRIVTTEEHLNCIIIEVE